MDGETDKNTQKLEACLQIGRSYKERGQIQHAIENYSTALKLAKESNEKTYIMKANIGLGDAYKSNQQFQTAINYYKKGLEIAKEQEDEQQEMQAYLGLGFAYKLKKKFRVAIEYFEKALKGANERENKEQKMALLGLGDVYKLKNEILVAEQYYKKASEIRSTMTDNQMAMQCIEETRENAEDQENKRLYEYIQFGHECRLNNQIPLAIKYYEKALEFTGKRKNTSSPQELEAYIGLGHAYRFKNQMELAIRYYEEALRVAKELADKHHSAEISIELGDIYDSIEHDQTAMEHYEKALNILEDVNEYDHMKMVALTRLKNFNQSHDHTISANSIIGTRVSAEQLLILGRSCQNNGNIEEAITNYEQAVQIADETHRNDIKAKAYQLLDDVFCGIFEYKKAIEYYKKALEISPDFESDDLEVEAYQNVHNVEHVDIEHNYENILDEERISLQRLLILGRSCQNNGKIEEAIKNYEQAVQIADETHRNDIKAKAYQHLGNICTGTSEYKKAIEHYKQAGEISPDIEADDFEVEAYQRLGETADNLERVDIEHKYENILDEERISLERLLILGRSCQNNGKIEEAIKNYEQAVQIAHETHRKDIKAKAYQHLGNVYSRASEYKKAIEYYKKAREVSPDLEADDLEVEAYQRLRETIDNAEPVDIEHKYENVLDEERISVEQLLILARSCQNNGKIEEAIKHCEQAVQIADKSHRKDIKAKVYQHLGNICTGTSEYKKAIEYYEMAHEISPDLEADDLEVEAYQRLRETIDNAEPVDIEHKYENVLDEERISVEQLLILARSCQDNGKIEEAIKHCEQAVQIADKTHRNDIKAKAYQHLGNICTGTSEYKKAIEYYKKAREISPDLEEDDLEGEAYQQLGETVDNVECVDIEHKYENILDEERISVEQLLILGRSCQNNGKIVDAITNYEQAVQIADETHRNDIKAKAYRHLENVFCGIFEYKKAIEYFEKAREISPDIESDDLDVEMYRTVHNFERVDIEHKYENTRDEERISAERLLILGRCCQKNGKIEEAIKNYEQAVQVAIKTHRNDIKTKAYQHLENVFCSTFEYNKAIECYEKARQSSLYLEACADDVDVEAYQDVDNVKRVDIDLKYENIFNEIRISAEQLLILGRSCQENEKIEEAIKHYEQAVQIADETHRTDVKAKAYQHLGNVCTGISEYKKAIEYYKKAREISPDIEADEMEAEAFQWLGDTVDRVERVDIVHGYVNAFEVNISVEQLLTLERSCQNNSKIKEVIKVYEQAVQISDEAHRNDVKAKACQDIGNVFTRTSEYKNAIEYYQKAREISPDLEGNELEVVAYQWLGYNHLQAAQYQKSIKYYGIVVKLASNIGDKKRKINAYLGLGSAFSYTNDFRSSRLYFLKALTIAENISNKALQKEAYTNLGAVYYKSCKFDEAAKKYLEVKKISHDLGDIKEEANACLMLGNAFRQLKQHEKAIEFYQKTLNISDDLEDEEMRTKVVQHLGTVYFTLASVCREDYNYEMAIKWFKKALDIFRQLNDNFWQKKAIESIQEAQKLAEKETERDSPESWKWEKSSIVHRERFTKLLDYGKDHPEDIKEVNGVRVCCSEEFLIGMGGDGTRVYVGLGKDGYERAVKRLPRDACAGLAKQEKNVLNKLNTTKSNYVVSYWFLDEQSDKHYLFLILDLCEETLENFVARSSLDELVANAPDIIQQLLKGLADLHCDPVPILHRDLKPSNILRNVHDKWLLADFGISRILTGCASTHPSNQRGTEDWRAVESSYPSNGMTDGGKVRYKKESDIQVAGIVAFYIVTKGEHPFGEKPDRLRHLLDGKPVGLDTLKDPILKDLLSWMLSHDSKDRPSAEEALKHPYLQSAKQTFEMLCKMGNQQEIKIRDVKSDVVRMLNSDPKDWRTLLVPDVLKYLSTDSSKGKTFRYNSSWTDCLRLIRNVKEHWHDRPRPRPAVFYLIGHPQEYFLGLFPNLPVEVHRIVRSCDWKERPELMEYFM